jgi:hypothetical protein
MGELSVSLLRLGYLLGLWLFVLAALATLRRDIYGTTIRRRDPAARRSGKRRGRVTVPSSLSTVAVGGPAAAKPSTMPPAAGTASHGKAGTPRVGIVSAAQEAHPGAPTKLVVKSGPLRGTTLPLARSAIVIGRSSSANLVLDDDFASARHAQIVLRMGSWVIEDLGSTNGTFVDRHKIAGTKELDVGATIRIGNTTLEVLK